MSSGNYVQIFHYPKSTLFWYDDFWGSVLDTRWATTGNAGYAVSLIDQQTNGICRLATPAVNLNYAMLHWNDIRSLRYSKEVSMETRFESNSVANHVATFGLYYDGNNGAQFTYDSAGGPNINTWTVSGGVGSGGAGIAFDTNYHIYQIQFHTHGSNHIHYFVDGVLTNTTTANIPTTFLQVWYRIYTRAATQKTSDIDYVLATQKI